MRRVLLALAMAWVAIVGAIPAAATLAATSLRSPHLHNQPPQHSFIQQNDASSGWIMTKPYIPVTTQMVLPQNGVTGSTVTQFALRFLGYQYTLVGNRPELGFSCIGFVSYVYDSLGIPLPDDLDNARAYAPPVQFSDLQPGDILWFGNTVWPGLSHVAIYLGGGRFIHSAWFGIGVIISSFQGDPRYGNYWTAHYMGASRPWGGSGSGTRSFTQTIVQRFLPQTVETVPDTPALLVSVPYLRLRRWWALTAPINRVVPQATPLVVMQRRGYWYHVMTPDGETGWMATAGSVQTFAVGSVAQADVPPAHVRRLFRVSGSQHATHRQYARRVARASRRRLATATAATTHRHRIRMSTAGRSTHRVRSHVAVRPRVTRTGSWYQVNATVRVHAMPGRSGAVLGVAGWGEHVKVLGTHGEWTHVRLPGGRTGYIMGSYIG